MTTLTEEKVVFAFAKAWNRWESDGIVNERTAAHTCDFKPALMVGERNRESVSQFRKTHQLVNASMCQML